MLSDTLLAREPHGNRRGLRATSPRFKKPMDVPTRLVLTSYDRAYNIDRTFSHGVSAKFVSNSFASFIAKLQHDRMRYSLPGQGATYR